MCPRVSCQPLIHFYRPNVHPFDSGFLQSVVWISRWEDPSVPVPPSLPPSFWVGWSPETVAGVPVPMRRRNLTVRPPGRCPQGGFRSGHDITPVSGPERTVYFPNRIKTGLLSEVTGDPDTLIFSGTWVLPDLDPRHHPSHRRGPRLPLLGPCLAPPHPKGEWEGRRDRYRRVVPPPGAAD